MDEEPLPFPILYRDAMMLVIDKPAGLAVHASGRDDNHLGHYLERLAFGLPHSPELAHRLDRETAGCLVLGRHRQALKKLGGLFANGRVEKTYWAVVVGQPKDDRGVIEAPLAKIRRGYGWRMQVDSGGQPSVTEWTVMGRAERYAWIECRPKTGRTHQIRVHLASVGLPIVGDHVYGQGTADLVSPSLHLLARAISLPLYPKKPPVTVQAAVPEALWPLFEACGYATQNNDTKHKDMDVT